MNVSDRQAFANPHSARSHDEPASCANPDWVLEREWWAVQDSNL
ncbi:MAG: hypothetical protein ABMA15_00930 [Vicinamibacterales bacterium]